ncbi:MAG: hypothetical protein QM504_08500 [Pseudomonadota bacterium]
MNKFSVLVVLNLHPEEVKKAIVEMNVKEYDFFKTANGAIINSGEWTDDQAAAVGVISNAFSSNEEYRQHCESDMQKEYFGKWKDIKLVSDIKSCEHSIFATFIL